MFEVLGSYDIGFQFAAAFNVVGGLVYLPHIITQYACTKKKDVTP